MVMRAFVTGVCRGRLFTRAVLAAFVLVVPYGLSHPAHSLELVMFKEPGCVWCAKWEDEIGVVYAKTEEGRRAPLRRVDKTSDRPHDLASVTAVLFTPTFVLMEGEIEIGRIVGYPGEHFFWPMLQALLARLDGDRVH